MPNPKYHHLISQTYLKAWCYSNKSIYVISKHNERDYQSRNIENNFGITQFHTIKAGMPICEENDLIKIYECLKEYNIFCKEKHLKNYREYNDLYSLFDKWIIQKDGQKISSKEKNILKNKIDNVKILDIENMWEQKYESKWNSIRDKIEENILYNDLTEVDEFDKDIIMKSIVAFNWRGFSSDEHFNEISKWICNIAGLQNISIPVESRQKEFLSTAEEEMRHYLLLRKYREFLRDKGIIYDMANNYSKYFNIKFYVATESARFITSDNPSFICDNIHGQKTHVFPISPQIVIAIGKIDESKGKYLIERIGCNEVNQINKLIYEHSINRLVSNINKLSK